MSQKTFEIVQGIHQAAANAYDGAYDADGKPLEIGLKREEGHPVYDSRRLDGFKIKIVGDVLTITYHTDVKLKEVYGTKFEQEQDAMCEQVKKYLQKEYKKITGKTLGLTAMGDCDTMVQSTSRVRVFAVTLKHYKIQGLEGVDENDGVADKGKKYLPAGSKDGLEASFKKFLEMSGDSAG
tara:strand:+ start:4675 stop:5217 length:543 start_codon:yes stop_codon:yes gene_type:complete